MDRPPIAYRNVTLDGTRVRGEYTTTEPTDVFPHGEWLPFDTDLLEWWVRLAIADDRGHQVLRLMFDLNDTGDVIAALRSASTNTRVGALYVAQRLTGQLMPASLLGVDVTTLDDAVTKLISTIA